VKPYNNCSAEFVDMKAAFEDAYIGHKHITVASYYRLLLPKVLPDCPKCLYLDGDIIVRGDLSEVFNAQIGQNYIAGIKDPPFIILSEMVTEEECRAADLCPYDRYVNAGVLLMNLDAIRRDGIDRRFIELSKRRLPFEDQDNINIACYDRIAHLPFRFNAMITYLNQLVHMSRMVFTAEEINEACENPLIIHYVGEKPWHNSAAPFAEHWWNTFRECSAGSAV